MHQASNAIGWADESRSQSVLFGLDAEPNDRKESRQVATNKCPIKQKKTEKA